MPQLKEFKFKFLTPKILLQSLRKFIFKKLIISLLNAVNFKKIEQVVLLQGYFIVIKRRNYFDSSSTFESLPCYSM